ncbi:hypothetical protein BD311DRAFT_689416 [Dichomitus squalens]|uniref:Coenzyme Q-binding protein COQ10 START domain-containing protein n=1 Tax=Dichomitus squalens TaxID=114155 RepID=A0A4Q9MVJ7_9APHY|nr:hypothetical protein BD311DRAFT_689416 [Dichomitus squalens]
MPEASTNLPPPSYSGPLTCYVSREISAPIERVWGVLSDFPKYPEWNPFVRSQEITDKSGKTVLEDQTPAKGKYLNMKVHIPPTMDDSVQAQTAFELIIHYDDASHRLAWKNLLPSWFIRAERWQALSITEDGKTLYESREVFAGIGVYLIKWFISKNLIKSFEAMADALKSTSEQ